MNGEARKFLSWITLGNINQCSIMDWILLDGENHSSSLLSLVNLNVSLDIIDWQFEDKGFK